MMQFSKALMSGALSLAVLSGAANVAQAQDKTYNMVIQAGVPNSSLYFKLIKDFGQSLEDMSSGRLKVSVVPDGAQVSAFEILDAVSNGVVTAGYCWANYWSGKNSAFVLFSNAPASTGLDQAGIMSWYYNGEGLTLYRELMKEMSLDVEPFPMQPMGPDPLGWFSKPFKSIDEFRSLKYRAPPGIAGQTYNEMGVPAVAMPGSELVPAAQRGTIDAAEWIGPADDRNLGLNKIWKFYYLQGLHQQTDVGELLINKTFWNKLPKDLQSMIRTAVLANAMRTTTTNLYENARAVDQYEKEGVKVLDTPDEYYKLFIKEQGKVVDRYKKENPYFAKVYDSQKAFAKLLYPYQSRVQKLYLEVVKGAEEPAAGAK